MRASQVYVASNPVNAEIFKGYLASYGIKAQVREQSIWGGMGDLPVNVYPSVWVDDANDHDRARALAARFEGKGEGEHAPTWSCPNCRERLDGQFDACWHCGCARPD